MASVAQRYRAKLSLAIPAGQARPAVVSALKTASSSLQACLRTVGGGKVGSLVSDAIDKIGEASHLEQQGKGENLSLASIAEVQGPKLKAAAKSLHSALKLAADQASKSGDRDTAGKYAGAAGKMYDVIKILQNSSSI